MAANLALRLRDRKDIEQLERWIVSRNLENLPIVAHVEPDCAELSPQRIPLLVQQLVEQCGRLIEGRVGDIGIREWRQPGRVDADQVEIRDCSGGVLQPELRLGAQKN